MEKWKFNREVECQLRKCKYFDDGILQYAAISGSPNIK